MSGSTVTANNFFAFHTVLKTSEDYYEAMRWARRLADNISDTINRNVSGMYVLYGSTGYGVSGLGIQKSTYLWEIIEF